MFGSAISMYLCILNNDVKLFFIGVTVKNLRVTLMKFHCSRKYSCFFQDYSKQRQQRLRLDECNVVLSTEILKLKFSKFFCSKTDFKFPLNLCYCIPLHVPLGTFPMCSGFSLIWLFATLYTIASQAPLPKFSTKNTGVDLRALLQIFPDRDWTLVSCTLQADPLLLTHWEAHTIVF